MKYLKILDKGFVESNHPSVVKCYRHGGMSMIGQDKFAVESITIQFSNLDERTFSINPNEKEYSELLYEVDNFLINLI